MRKAGVEESFSGKNKGAGNPRIRLANSADTPELLRITNTAFAIETFLEGTRIGAEGLIELTSKGAFLLAEDPLNRVIASVYVELRGERGYFGVLAVDPSQQGAGLGRAMVEAAEDFCRQRGCKEMDITVLSLRPELLPFYRKLGYREIGTEPFHPARPLKDGQECHCILMAKSLGL
jgi:GNAT superfamily N-acetyltransferase